MVEIAERDGDRPAVTLGALQLGLRRQHEMAAIDETGQAIARGQEFQFAACRLGVFLRGMQALRGLLDGVDFAQADSGKFGRWLVAPER